MIRPPRSPLAVVPDLPAPALEQRDDEALMVLAGAERRDAFEALVRRHLARLARFCAKLTGDARAGEELAQEALLEVWVQRRAYHAAARFRPWLFTLARNRCLNHLRAERRRLRWSPRPPAGAGGEVAPDAPLAPEQVDLLLAAEEARQVRQALLALSTKLREAVLLRFDLGLDYAEIARIVGTSEVTARSRVFMALKRLRALVGEEKEVP